MIDAKLLVAAVGCTQALGERFAAPITDACRLYNISTSKRLAAFLAQIGHESGSFRYTAEVWGPTAAQSTYEGRANLGNTELGDGYRFRGRGLIQTTGRANHRTLTQRLRARGIDCPDFEQEPERLEEPWWAALSAADYWDMRGLNALADADDFIGITKKINGGTNGLADRQARWEKAKTALKEIEVAPLLVGLGMSLIQSLAPLAAEKVTKALDKHTDHPEIGEQIVNAVVDAAKTATGIADATEAVVAAKKDPAVMEQVQQAALLTLDQMAPMLDKIDAMERQAFKDEEDSRNSAATRSASESWDMAKWLIGGAFAMAAWLFWIISEVTLRQLSAGGIASEVWAAITGLIGFTTGVLVTIFSYRFGSSRSSAAKDVLISELKGKP